MEARGVAVANSLSANPRGVRFESLKLMSENETSPDVTSGTLAIVLVVPQVTSFWMAAALSATSAGRTLLPTTKQALA